MHSANSIDRVVDIGWKRNPGDAIRRETGSDREELIRNR